MGHSTSSGRTSGSTQNNRKISPEEVMQNVIGGYGFGLKVEELATRVYRNLRNEGFDDVSVVNDRYIEIGEKTYAFRKSTKEGRWILKAI